MTAAPHTFPLADAGQAGGDLPAWFHDEPWPAEGSLDEMPSGEFPILPDPAIAMTVDDLSAAARRDIALLRQAIHRSRQARGDL